MSLLNYSLVNPSAKLCNVSNDSLLTVDIVNLVTLDTNLQYVGLEGQSNSNDWHYPSQPYLVDDEPTHEEELDVMLADPELAKPPMYAVIMYNDDYTPMEFVVHMLQAHFRHSVDSAVEIMFNIHNQGRGIAGIYPKDIAETKAKTVNTEAKKLGYPLLTQIEPHQGE